MYVKLYYYAYYSVSNLLANVGRVLYSVSADIRSIIDLKCVSLRHKFLTNSPSNYWHFKGYA